MVEISAGEVTSLEGQAICRQGILAISCIISFVVLVDIFLIGIFMPVGGYGIVEGLVCRQRQTMPKVANVLSVSEGS